MAKGFPEKDRPELRPDEQGPCYHKNSQSMPSGHEQFDSRMPHPFREAPPQSESGEGKGSKG